MIFSDVTSQGADSMVTGMFTISPGRSSEDAVRNDLPHSPHPHSAADRASESDVVYALRPGSRHTVAVTVVSAEVCMRKTVERNGQTRLELDRGPDRVVVSADHARLTLSRGEDTITLSLPPGAEEDLIRLRSALVASPAVRAFRALATAVDETESDTAERLAVRLSGRLLAQFDGDQGAIRRLSRELHDRYARRLKQGKRQVPLDWDAYQTSIVRACAELQLGVSGLSYWSPLRHARALEWLMRVEATWYLYVASALTWRARQ
jgi:hypothetical protein